MTFRVTLDTSAFDNLSREIRGELAGGSAAVVTQVAEDAAKHARDNHPYTDQTWNLTTSIEGYLVEASVDGAEAVLETQVEYASFVEKGTSRSKPYPFLEPARVIAEKELHERLEAMVRRAFGRFGR